MAQWLHDCTKETERAQKSANLKNRAGENLVNGIDEPSDKKTTRPTDTTALSAADQEFILLVADRRRQHILYKVGEPPETWRQRRRLWNNAASLSTATFGKSASTRGGRGGRGAQMMKQPSCETTEIIFRGALDYEDSCLVCRYLASLRPFSQSFDVYLSQICKVSGSLCAYVCIVCSTRFAGRGLLARG